jgi:hypothetical protein
MNSRIFLLVLAISITLTSCGSSSKQETATSSESAQQQAAPPPAPEPPKPIVISAGTAITVTLDQALGSKSSQTGDRFSATVAEPVSEGGKVVIPKDSKAMGSVVEAKAKGKVKGEARLKLALVNVTIHGTSYPITTSMSESTEKGKGKRTAVTTGGGAAVGALIGGIAGGGKGAAIGLGVGAAAGLAGGALTGNSQIELPAETRLTFELTNSLTLNPSSRLSIRQPRGDDEDRRQRSSSFPAPRGGHSVPREGSNPHRTLEPEAFPSFDCRFRSTGLHSWSANRSV